MFQQDPPQSNVPDPSGIPASITAVVTIEASVIRADGTVEDLGVIASSADGSAEISKEEVDE